MSRSGARGRLWVSAAVASLWLAGAAGAQVLDVGGDGSVTVHKGPEMIVGALDHAIPMAPTSTASRTARGAAVAGPRSDLGAAASASGLSEHLISAVASQESGWNPAAISPKGARGLMQLMPGTATALGVDASDPHANLLGGARYLAGLLDRFDGDLPKALAAYNAGPGAVARYQGTPPYKETRRYVDAVLARLAAAASGDRQP